MRLQQLAGQPVGNVKSWPKEIRIAYLAFLAGGLLLAGIVSRVLRKFAFGKLIEPANLLASNLVTLYLATVIGGFGT